jgi:prolycopene isomerase
LKAAHLVHFFVISVAFYLVGCGAKTPLRRDVETDFDVIVVGAGIGGLSAAAHLANKKMRVLVLEQHHKVGGCATSFERTLMDKAGVADKVELIRVPNLGRTVFPGIEFVHPNGIPNTVRALSERWPKERKNIERFYEMLVKMNQELLELKRLFMANPVGALFFKLAVPFRQRTLSKYHDKTVREVLDEFFDDENLKAVLSQFWIYQGPPPSEQWALIYFVAYHTFLENGAWQYVGSSQALSDAYRDRIVEQGGQVRTSTLVTAINVNDKDKVTGVEIDSKESITSRYVVSNADPFQTFFKLIGEEKTPRKLAKKIRTMEPNNSLAGVYLGLDVDHTFFDVEDYEIFYSSSLNMDRMFEKGMSGQYDEAFITITISSVLEDEFYAPEGMTTVSIQVVSDIANWPERGDAYERQKEEMTNQLVDLAERVLPGLREHIVQKTAMTPRTIESFTLNHRGVPYGWNFTVDQSDRLPLKTGIGGLYLAGAWSWPAHSVAMTQLSGYLTSRLILKEEDVLNGD